MVMESYFVYMDYATEWSEAAGIEVVCAVKPALDVMYISIQGEYPTSVYLKVPELSVDCITKEELWSILDLQVNIEKNRRNYISCCLKSETEI